MNSKKTLHLAALLTLLSFVACKNKDTLQPENTEIELTLEDPNESESDYVFDSTAATNIILKNTSAEITGPGVKLTGSTITITQAGVYNVSGTLSNGQLVIDSADDENVNLLFNGIHITNKTSSAVSVVNAEKVVVKLIENSVNSLTDGTYNTTDEKNATFYSKSDISFFGSGKLVVNANYQDGIVSKDGLIIESGTYEVRAVDDGIRGKDYLIIHNGTFDITAGGDGLAADNDEDAERGYVTIENGNYTINSGADGIQAVSVLTLDNGTYVIQSGGGSSKTSATSAKALKAGIKLQINDGDFEIDAADDALHSNKYLQIDGGNFNIKTVDDGAHADEELIVNGGIFTVSKSYEGIESKIITIHDGIVRITSSDDGINATDGTSNGGFPGGNTNGTPKAYLYLHGGFITVNSSGDGLDANGSIEMSGGTVLVHGPTQNNNGAIDYDNAFKITGGTLIAAGSAGMAQSPSNSSTQKYISLRTSQSANTFVDIRDSRGTSILCFKPLKNFQSLVVSTPTFTTGSYTVFAGGTNEGTNEGGLITNGTYTGGSQVTTFSL